METIKRIGRLLIWPFLVTRDINSGDHSPHYINAAGSAVISGLLFLFSALVMVSVPFGTDPLWSFSSMVANAVIFLLFAGYFIVGIAFCIVRQASIPSSNKWYDNGPW